MPRLRASYGVQCDRVIECDQATSSMHRQRQQIDIGELPRPVNAGRVDDGRVEQAYVIGPEFVYVALRRRREALDDELRGDCVRVCGV